ncbi:ATP-binding protein [Streptomonospora sp. PA3]|uniref:Swt1 family HEPN domain-containing protein n=1 Tax=Streptomonospora sp. PA3 TaxID=2607326 RepID=UPI0012DEF49A|nr:Swt1 family HEPN domain-containing protein [Streptomonospora sp. PA3]MUL40947.1 ATP-binding protein [Streptomonospora sp. PA3]
MAASNRDRVGQGFEILAEGLKPFVETRMSAAAPSGQDWLEFWKRREEKRSGSGYTYSKDDPQLLLRILTEEWRVFKDHLSRAESSLASELRQTRNEWAHNAPFSFDDAYRALDTTERLLSAVGATEQAERVRKMRIDLQRATYEAETKRNAKAAETPVSVPGSQDGHGLKPWREVLHPHTDIATGNYAAAEFAADLHRVAFGDGTSSAEYADPMLFFQRTYLTDGLRDLLTWAVRRIGGDTNAPPIVNLQTNFGGGKTHSMLSLWHLFSGEHGEQEYPQEFQELLDGRGIKELGGRVRRVALVGNHIPAGEARTMADGTVLHTLWGELAWQLGGREAYDIVAEADRTRSNPASALNDLIQAYSPCLILVDEWVAYARQLYDRDDLPGGSFATQFTFAQTLTEVVSGIPGSMLVVSIPASHESTDGSDDSSNELETGGANGRAALQSLQNAIRRKADQWRPASSHESFEIVRRRLFQEPDSRARSAIDATARAYLQFYAKHRDEFPSGSAELDYEKRIKATYPIHPELFQRLYDDWSALDRFQRTRGVLRLMSVVIHELWRDEDPAPLIMPGSIPLDAHRVRTEISQYLEDNFKPVIDADIDGADATPNRIDTERTLYGQRRLTTRLARTIFFGSAPTLKGSNKGIDQQRIWLGTAIPGDTVGNFGGALHLLSDRAHYLYSDGSRYWYDTQPSVTRLARDHAERLREHPEDVWAYLRERLQPERRRRGAFAAVNVAVEHTNEVRDTDVASLVILHPRYAHTRRNDSSDAREFADSVLRQCGSAQRTNRNMVVFLAPDERRLAELTEAARDHIAWKGIVDRLDELELSPQQAAHARGKLASADEAVAGRIPQTYFWVFAPMQRPGRPLQWEELRADRGPDGLAERVTEKLRANAQLLSEISAPAVRRDLDSKLGSEQAWGKGYLTFGDLWGYCCKYAYLPRLTGRHVLEDAIRACFDRGVTWEHEGFALAESYDEGEGRFSGLLLPMEDPAPAHISDAMLLVRPDLAVSQREAEKAAREAAQVPSIDDATRADPGGTAQAEGTHPTPDSRKGQPSAPSPQQPQRPANTRFYGSYTVDPGRYGRDFTNLAQEVLRHLVAVEGADVTISVEIKATHDGGFAEDTVRVVSENANTLKFDEAGFADE